MEHAEGRFVIVNELGMHARAAAKLVRLASEFECAVTVEKDGQRADAKSVMGVLLLCGQKGAEIVVRAEGPSAERAVREIGALIQDRFHEER
jgi:phosphocarrier protein HPr